jgi:uncharacterized membrane protein YeaQ/YmgE (transglycosylase-associated protein family)
MAFNAITTHGEGAGFIGAIVGAVIVLAIWGFMQNRRTPV